METQNVEAKAAKRIRKRKKQKINEIRQQMEFYFSDSNLSKDRFLNQLISNDPSEWILKPCLDKWEESNFDFSV